jgi:hypothetical protein
MQVSSLPGGFHKGGGTRDDISGVRSEEVQQGEGSRFWFGDVYLGRKESAVRLTGATLSGGTPKFGASPTKKDDLLRLFCANKEMQYLDIYL